MSDVFSFLTTAFNSWPLAVALLAIIIAVFLVWFFKLRPEEKAKEEARDEANRKRETEFLTAMTRNDENAKNTIVMYEKALDNSTRAIENNTAALNLMSSEMKSLKSVSENHDEALERLGVQSQKVNENMVKVVTLLESKDLK